MTRAIDHPGRSFLRRSARAYEAVVARVMRLEARGDDEATARWLAFAASTGWAAHPGRFADERLEAVGLRIGQRLEPRPRLPNAPARDPIAGATTQRRVLHVATTTYQVGGHTRLIENWISKDKAATHSLILIDQQDHTIRDDLAGLVAASGGELMVLPTGGTLLDKARQLRLAVQEGYGVVVLHHHPNDVVPLIALAAEDGPPVAVMNHADHVYWIGISVADAVIDFREYGARVSRDRRGTRRSMMFPLPLDLKTPGLTRAHARALLGVPSHETVLLSIGSAYKYKPTKTYNFLHTLHRVLAANPTARLYMIGVGPNDLPSFDVPTHDRVELLGLVDDPSVFEAAADLYLEGFPLNSYTALLETAARKVCPVLMYAAAPQLDLSNDAALEGLVASAPDEAAYVAQVTALIGDPAARAAIGEAVAQRIVTNNSGDIGAMYLQPIYDRLAGIQHRPEVSPSMENMAMEEDLNLASFNSGQGITTVLSHTASRMLNHLTITDVMRALIMSVRVGDTRLSAAQIRSWLGVLRRKAFAERHLVDTVR